MTTSGYTDFHNHLIPGVDDGARDAEESAAALAAFRQQHVTQVITTPHLDGSLTHDPAALERRLADLDAGWKKLRAVVANDAERMGSPLRVERGAEVMLDIPDPDLSDARVRLAGGPFVLVEFPGMRLPPVNASLAIASIRRRGWIPVVAHPERYRNMPESLEPLDEFLRAGAFLQVNAGSLLGNYGKTAAKLAREILRRGLASYISADYHASGVPATKGFLRVLADAGCMEQAELLAATNPGRLLNGESPLPVPPIADAEAAAPWWRRMLGG